MALAPSGIIFANLSRSSASVRSSCIINLACDLVLVRDALIGLRKHRPITQQQDHHWDDVDLLCQRCSSKNLDSARPRPPMGGKSLSGLGIPWHLSHNEAPPDRPTSGRPLEADKSWEPRKIASPHSPQAPVQPRPSNGPRGQLHQ